jgi:hypothetical protein
MPRTALLASILLAILVLTACGASSQSPVVQPPAPKGGLAADAGAPALATALWGLAPLPPNPPGIPAAAPAEPGTPEPRPTAPRAAGPASGRASLDPAFDVQPGRLVRVYAGPGTNYPLLGALAEGTYAVTGANPSRDWWQFAYGGRPAWVDGREAPVVVAGRAPDIVAIPPPPAPAGGAGPTDLWNPRVTEVSKNQILVMVDYRYNGEGRSDECDGVLITGRGVQTGDPPLFAPPGRFTSIAQPIRPGASGTGIISLSYERRGEQPLPSLTTSQLRITISACDPSREPTEPGMTAYKVVFSKDFVYPKTWSAP